MEKDKDSDIKRLFFGFEVLAPWLPDLPRGRILSEHCRHMTIVFLGSVSYSHLISLLSTFPKPYFKVGQAGYFDRPLFLPERHPHVVAWHMQWLNYLFDIEIYYKQCLDWLKAHSVRVDARDQFLPHVTLSRSPFSIHEWKKNFIKLPFIIKDLHLFESLGNLQYQSRWSYPLKIPFEEFEHTADIAFSIHGEKLLDIYHHAFIALAFKFPPLLDYFTPFEGADLDDLIMQLNDVVGRADIEKGCPFKAISYHGEIKQEEDQTLTWEMIVDV